MQKRDEKLQARIHALEHQVHALREENVSLKQQLAQEHQLLVEEQSAHAATNRSFATEKEKHTVTKQMLDASRSQHAATNQMLLEEQNAHIIVKHMLEHEQRSHIATKQALADEQMFHPAVKPFRAQGYQDQDVLMLLNQQIKDLEEKLSGRESDFLESYKFQESNHRKEIAAWQCKVVEMETELKKVTFHLARMKHECETNHQK